MWQDESFTAGAGRAYSGSRMSLWSDYEASVQWNDWDHTVRVLRVYEEVMAVLLPEYREKVNQQLTRNGFHLADDGRIEYIAATSRITEVTRTRIADFLWSTVAGMNWSGRLEDIDFLKRLYNLESIPSNDPRFENAELDIWQHTVNNDWDSDWVFKDPRFGLHSGSDAPLLRFLVEMVHPAVRTADDVSTLVSGLNEALAPDGYELYEQSMISGRPIFSSRLRSGFHGATPDHLLRNRPAVTDPAVLQEHLDRIRRSLEDDPAAAIGSCKELIETLLKLILDHSAVEYTHKDDVLDLYKKTATLLAVNAESVDGNAKGSQASQRILRSLTTSIQGIAELRNELGLGHGRTTRSNLRPRHARLAMNSTVTVTEFLLDTWHDRISTGKIAKEPLVNHAV